MNSCEEFLVFAQIEHKFLRILYQMLAGVGVQKVTLMLTITRTMAVTMTWALFCALRQYR